MRVCQSCSHDNRDQARFCGRCGGPLNEQASAQAPPAQRQQHNLDESSPTPPVGTHAQDNHRLSWHGSILSLLGIFVVNLLLTLLTLGLYRFWAKVRVRRYLLSQIEFEADRFAYHGQGKELLMGFLKVLVVFGIPYALLGSIPVVLPQNPTTQLIVALLSLALGFIFVPIATVGVRRYRLSRTSWRGIRFSFRGTPSAFLKLVLKGSLFSLVTLGAYYPWFMIERQRFLVSHSYCGNHAFQFDGRGRDLWQSYMLLFAAILLAIPVVIMLSRLPSSILAGLFLIPVWGLAWRDVMSSPVPAILLSLLSAVLYVLLFSLNSQLLAFLLIVPLVGACWLWFSVKKQRYLWDHTSILSARFHSTVTADGLLFLRLQNILLLIASLGLAWPWVSVRTLQFVFAHLHLAGQLDLSSIQQEAQSVPTTGAGFLSFLDTDLDLG